MNKNPFNIQDENWDSVCDFTQNCCNVGNFILPALLHSQIPDQDYIFDIDLDFWTEEMGIEDFEATLEKVKNLISSAKLVTIATSPYFLDQSKGLELIHQLFD